MKLSTSDRQILLALERDADQSAAAISHETGVRAHTVQYTLAKFRSQKALQKRYFVNTFRLGFSRHSIFFSLASHRPRVIAETIEYLRAAEGVSLVLELGGDFQFEVCLTFTSSYQFSEFLNDFGKRFGRILLHKSVALQIAHRVFGTRCLLPRAKDIAHHEHSLTKDVVEIDATDRRLLSVLSNKAPETKRELSRETGIPASTLEHRLRALSKEKVLVGSTYLINLPQLSHFILLLNARGLSLGFKELLLKFCTRTPAVFYYVECAGSWDYELGLTVEDSLEANQVVRELYETLGSELIQVRMLSLFARHKVSDFPF